MTLKANYLVQVYGYNIHIITTDQASQDIFYQLDSRIKKLDLDINFDKDKNLLSKLIYRHIRQSKYKNRLINYIRENKIDICISLGWKEINFLQDLKKYCKVICERHFAINAERVYANNHYGPFMAKIIGNYSTRKIIKSTKNIDALVVLTKEDKQAWEKFNTNVVQIYNPSPFEIKASSNLSEKRLITVGRLEPQKGYDYLIEACIPVFKKYPEWRIDIYGDGSQKQYLQNMISDTHMDDNICLCGVSKNIQQEYLKSSAFIMSSRYEGFPMVLLEAASFGLPLISFDCVSGPREIILHGFNGLLVELNDISGLSRAIEKIIEDYKLRQEMGINSIERANQFTIDSIMKQWDSLFRRMINSRQ